MNEDERRKRWLASRAGADAHAAPEGTDELPTLAEIMEGETVVSVKPASADWVEIELSNRFRIQFKEGAVIIHPDNEQVN